MIFANGLRLLAAAMIAMLSGVALAESPFPTRPIRFITPYAPGGSTTMMARLVGQHFTSRWGQNVIVDNRPGGGTLIGTGIVAKSLPDGYTILLTSSTHSILSNLMKTPYDPIKDFAAIASIGIAPHLLVLHPSVPASTVPELISLAKASPGQLTFASSGAGGTSHMAGEVFNMLAGVKTWNGILAPAGTPRAIVDKMSAEVAALLAIADVKEKLEAMGLTTMISTPEQFGAMIKAETGMYMKVIRASNMKLD